MIASLPMYDLPALHSANDLFWQAIRGTLGHGPAALTRTGDLWDHWQSPDLLLSQTCGFPYRARLHGHVQLVATPDFGLPDCPAGHYNSVFVARRTDKISALEDLAGKRFAFNEPMSQSGWAAPKVHLDSLGLAHGPLIQTGGHALSAAAVAEGRADFAALDAQTWRLLTRHTPLGDALDVVAQTAPTPALPYITSLTQDAEALFVAMSTALSTLDSATQDALGLKTLVTLPSQDYPAVATPKPPQI